MFDKSDIVAAEKKTFLGLRHCHGFDAFTLTVGQNKLECLVQIIFNLAAIYIGREIYFLVMICY